MLKLSDFKKLEPSEYDFDVRDIDTGCSMVFMDPNPFTGLAIGGWAHLFATNMKKERIHYKQHRVLFPAYSILVVKEQEL